MNINLFKKELERNLKSLLAWSLIISFLISLTMSVYPVFIQNQSKIFGLLNIVPKGALEFKGISNINDLLSVIGFYSANNIIYMMVLGSIFSIVLTSGILLKEEYQKTAEYLYSRPMDRREIFTSKLAAAVVNIAALNIITALAGYIWIAVLDKSETDIKPFMVLSAYTLMLTLLFGSAGLMFSMLVRRARPVTTGSIGIVLIMYFIFTVSKITKDISALGWISPYRFADTDVFRADYALNGYFVLYFLGLTMLFTSVSYRLFIKRDIYV